MLIRFTRLLSRQEQSNEEDMNMNFKYSTLYIYCALHNSSIFLSSIFPTRHIVEFYISPICGNHLRHKKQLQQQQTYPALLRHSFDICCLCHIYVTKMTHIVSQFQQWFTTVMQFSHTHLQQRRAASERAFRQEGFWAVKNLCLCHNVMIDTSESDTVLCQLTQHYDTI